jgi:hypothetical protein
MKADSTVMQAALTGKITEARFRYKIGTRCAKPRHMGSHRPVVSAAFERSTQVAQPGTKPEVLNRNKTQTQTN